MWIAKRVQVSVKVSLFQHILLNVGARAFQFRVCGWDAWHFQRGPLSEFSYSRCAPHKFSAFRNRWLSRFPLSLSLLAFVQDARARSTLIGNRSMILCHPIDEGRQQHTLLWRERKNKIKEPAFLRWEISVWFWSRRQQGIGAQRRRRRFFVCGFLYLCWCSHRVCFQKDYADWPKFSDHSYCKTLLSGRPYNQWKFGHLFLERCQIFWRNTSEN